jgi:hypothetical protein
MSKITARPWKVWRRGNIGPNLEPEIWIGIDHPKYGELSHVTVRAGCDETKEVGCMEANAAHIVRCVNLHDELIKALCDAHNQLLELSPALRPDGLIKHIRALVAKAESEK